MAVVGANGSGKSTLARLLGGLARPAGAARAASAVTTFAATTATSPCGATSACCSRTPTTSSSGRPSKRIWRSVSRTSRCPRPRSPGVSTRCWTRFDLEPLARPRTAPAVGRPAAANGAGRCAGGAAPRARAGRADRDARPGRSRRGAGRRAPRGRSRPDGRSGHPGDGRGAAGRQGRGPGCRPGGLRRPARRPLCRARAAATSSRWACRPPPRSVWRSWSVAPWRELTLTLDDLVAALQAGTP